jgi:hypothetical protein
MNPIIKEKWVKALRSGEYKQGKGILRAGEASFCCLGVLCDLYGRDTGEEWKGGGCEDDDCEEYAMSGATALLPVDVQDWAGLGDEDPLVKEHTLSEWNDSQGRDFAAIADLIEEAL